MKQCNAPEIIDSSAKTFKLLLLFFSKTITNFLPFSSCIFQISITGTGKTFTGVKLVYLFNKLNKLYEEKNGKRRRIIFCGPSNKSVDLVASMFDYVAFI